MSATKTKFPKNPVPARKVHQATTIVGKNGLPVDAQATIEPGSVLLSSNGTEVTYNSPTVTFDSGVNLSNLENFNIKVATHTGKLIFTDSSNNSYFIDPDSIDNINKTIDIYIQPDYSVPPSSIATANSWFASEAELVNRLQTTTTAVIDNVEFRDVQVNVDLDGSTVNIKDDDGDQLEINENGSINTILLNRLIDVEHDDIEVLTKNDDGNPLVIAIRFEGNLVRTLTLSYDSDGDFRRVQRT